MLVIVSGTAYVGCVTSSFDYVTDAMNHVTKGQAARR